MTQSWCCQEGLSDNITSLHVMLYLTNYFHHVNSHITVLSKSALHYFHLEKERNQILGKVEILLADEKFYTR